MIYFFLGFIAGMSVFIYHKLFIIERYLHIRLSELVHYNINVWLQEERRKEK